MDKTQQNQSVKKETGEKGQKESKEKVTEIPEVKEDQLQKTTDAELCKLRDVEKGAKQENYPPTQSAKQEQINPNNQQFYPNQQYNPYQAWPNDQYGNYGHGYGYGHHGHHGPFGYGHHGRGHHGRHHRGHHGFGSQPYSYNQGEQQQNQIPPQYYQHFQYPPPPPPFMMPPGQAPHQGLMPPFMPYPPPPPFQMGFPRPPHAPPFPMGFPHPPPPQMPSSSQTGVSNMPEQGYGRRGHCHRGRHHHGKWQNRRSRSRSSSSSSSSSDEQRKSKRKIVREGNSIKPQKQQLTILYEKQMNGFMQSRMINEMQREKIIKVLRWRFPQGNAPIDHLLQYIEIIEKENLVFRMSYVKIIKVLIRFEFDLSQAILKLQKIQRHKIKKFQADKQFNEDYGEQQQTPLLQVNDLIILHSNNKNVIYLIDGNNILPTNKHLRRYFQSKKKIQKVISQIRCQWYISHCFKQEAFLFFDEKFEEGEYQIARKIVFRNKEEQQRSKQIPVIYGDGIKADNKIIEKLQQLITKDEKSQIILITADRDLNMRCQQLKPILHTSGRYFFKYLKYKLNRQYKGDKYMKHMSKEILLYQQCKDYN